MSQRNSGLDFFRTFAILFVLISHSRHLFTYLKLDFNLWYFSVGGYLGVELFFVLSGFLIGDILFKKVLNSKNIFYNLKVFFIRRWYRTLPLYYFFLIVFIFFHLIYFHKFYFPFLHLFFLQNFDKQALNFFAVSWSLSVEEWFYLLVPLIILTGFIFKRVFLIIFLIFLYIGIIKVVIVLNYPDLTWTDIRKNIFLRFDSLIVGVFFAYLKNYYESIFNLFSKKIFLLIGLLGILFLVAWYYYKLQVGLDKDFFSKAFMFQVTSIFLAFIMIYLYFNFKSNNKLWYYGSIYSYSIYLMHFLFLLPFIKIAHKYQSLLLSFLLLILFFILNIFFASLIYRFIEKPILDKRVNYMI